MKRLWQEIVNDIEKFQQEDDLSVREVATTLNISVGKVSNALNLAAALRVYPKLEKIDTLVAALAFVKQKKFHRKVH